jgi:hypothetical protein
MWISTFKLVSAGCEPSPAKFNKRVKPVNPVLAKLMSPSSARRGAKATMDQAGKYIDAVALASA